MKDSTLVLGVVLMVAMDVIILIVYSIVEGMRGNLAAHRDVHMEKPMKIEGVRDT
jgi:hypothetical protein